MTFRWTERRKRQNAWRSRRWPLVSMAVILTGGFVWELIHLHTTLTMSCEGYYAQWTHGHVTGQSLLQTVALFVAALVLWWLADLFRPKPHRTAIFARLFEGLILASMIVVTLFNWGLLFPEGRVFPVANQVMAYFNPTEPDWHPWHYEELPHGLEYPFMSEPYETSTLEWTSFRQADGRMLCTIERDFWEHAQTIYWVVPSAITDPPD